VLDEGAAPAQRNQALIDAPPAAAVAAPLIVPPAAAGTFAGVAEVVTSAAQQKAAEVPLSVGEAALTPAAPTTSADSDDLRRIKGLGPKLVATLHALGITRFAQIAAWTDADLDDLDTKLGAFAGRPRRDNWVEQAQLLSGGDTGAYEAKFGKL
jgi:predicted flap endonuclease-1-like 5' DNA nuclease